KDHGLARTARARQGRNQLQIARLVIFAAALLGRALSDCLGEWQASGAERKRITGRTAATRGLQAHRHRRTAAGQSERLGPLFRQIDARNQCDAAVGGLVLVLLALLRSTER